MLGSINDRIAASTLSPLAQLALGGTQGGFAFRASETSIAAQARITDDSVVLSVSISTLDIQGTLGASPDGMDASGAGDPATRGLEALEQIKNAKVTVAGRAKEFLRHRMEGLKQQMQMLRLLGRDPLEIAKGSLKIAREVAGATRDYAAATKDENAAGGTESTEDAKQAQKDFDALKAKADRAPLDGGSDSSTDAPTDPDERFFYDAVRLLGLARKTVNETQRIDSRQHGFAHAKDFKKIQKRMADMEQAVTLSYVAMKTNGDLKDVDHLLSDSAGGGGGGFSVLA